MKQCSRVGVNVTRKCNWNCKHCFYRFSDVYKGTDDIPIEEVKSEIFNGKKRGCDQAVFIGYGEPSLYKHIHDAIMYCNALGMKSSMITNGSTGVDRFKSYYDIGLNHLHMSCHGVGNTLDVITETNNASDRQHDLKSWLNENKKPWRANITLQQLNYFSLPAIASNLISYGCKHVILLGFLPHYEWADKSREIAVHPRELAPLVEAAIDVCIESNIYCTLRYFPFCHLNSKYWKYVVNARYVLYDPWEWDYNFHGIDEDGFKIASLNMGDSVACDVPCNKCAVREHCGGWNKVYAATFNGANLESIKPTDILDLGINLHDVGSFGFFFEQNPVNQLPGYF